MRDAEMLSRMLDGELPVRESEELRARMRVEPELAELYAALQGLPGELAELPDEAPPSWTGPWSSGPLPAGTGTPGPAGWSPSA